MKTRIGAEITRPTIRRLVDLREPLVPSLSPRYRGTRKVNKEGNTGGAKENVAEQASVGSDTGYSEETDRVRSREVAFSEATAVNSSWYQKVGAWPWRLLLIRSAKLGLFLGFSVVFLSINIDLPERLIAVYALASVLYRIDSQRTFLVALIFLVLVAVWSMGGDTTQAEKFAVYAFYFLVIGLVGALRELKAAPAETGSE